MFLFDLLNESKRDESRRWCVEVARQRHVSAADARGVRWRRGKSHAGRIDTSCVHTCGSPIPGKMIRKGAAASPPQGEHGRSSKRVFQLQRAKHTCFQVTAPRRHDVFRVRSGPGRCERTHCASARTPGSIRSSGIAENPIRKQRRASPSSFMKNTLPGSIRMRASCASAARRVASSHGGPRPSTTRRRHRHVARFRQVRIERGHQCLRALAVCMREPTQQCVVMTERERSRTRAGYTQPGGAPSAAAARSSRISSRGPTT